MTLLIADVSEFQNVNWQVYGAVNPAVIVRAHNGWRIDNHWAVNLAGSRKFCQWRGFYQYLPASVDPRAAARAFAAAVGPMLPGEVAILDLEEGTGDQTARRAAWLDELHAAVEWTYSGLYFARDHLAGVQVEWVAAYQGTEPTDHHLLWQNTNAQPFAGIGACDGSRFNGTLQDLQALTQGASTVAITPDDAKAVAAAVWGADVIPTTWASPPDPTNPTWGASTYFGFLGQWVVQARAYVLQVQKAIQSVGIDALAGRVAAEAALAQSKANADAIKAVVASVEAIKPGGLTADEVKAAVAEVLNVKTASVQIDVTGTGTTP